MLVTCPRCESVFKLPDSSNQQIKMRCSICNNVFQLSEANPISEDDSVKLNGEAPTNNNYKIESYKIDDATVEKKSHPILRIFVVLIFLGMASAGMLMKFTTVLDPVKMMFNSGEPLVEEMSEEGKKRQEEEAKSFFDRISQLELINVRQFVVPNSENDKFEKLTVIEGSVINRFDTPRSFIELEATLYDGENNVLDSKTQMAGPRASFFQLQVLGKEQLEETLEDNLYILNHNTNVKPTQTVPFMFIFYNPPKHAANFNVKIVNAQVTGNEGSEGENQEGEN